VVEVDDRAEPIGADESGISGDKEGAIVAVVDLKEIEVYLDSGRGYEVGNVNHSRANYPIGIGGGCGLAGWGGRVDGGWATLGLLAFGVFSKYFT
jgi:hypothetical protein